MENENEGVYRRADYFKDDLPIVVWKGWQRSESFIAPGSINRREFWKIFYVVSGKGTLKINRRSYPIHPGFVCLNHPDDLTNVDIEQSIELYNVLFDQVTIEHDLARLYNDNHFFSIFRSGFRPERSLNHELLHLIDSNRRIFQEIKRMHYEYTHGDANTGEMLRFMLLELLVEFSRQSARFYQRRRRGAAVAHIDNYLRRNFGEPLRSEEIAREVGLSRGYLFDFYRKATRRTIGETLLAIRIEEAGKLLQETDMEITQICYRCGFTDLSYFYKLFKRETGTTPGNYRKGRVSE